MKHMIIILTFAKKTKQPLHILQVNIILKNIYIPIFLIILNMIDLSLLLGIYDTIYLPACPLTYGSVGTPGTLSGL